MQLAVTRGNGENESTKELQRVFMANAREALQKYLTIERGKLRDKIGQGTTVCKVRERLETACRFDSCNF